MAKQIIIAGHEFDVPERYEEGHELTANEANALNQTYAENLRNNFAKKVNDAKNGAETISDTAVLAKLQDELTEYANKYEFGERVGGGGGPRDPVASEALRIAKDKVHEHLRNNGVKRKDWEAEKITAKAKELIAKNPSIMELAKQRVAEMQSIASAALEGI